MALWNYAYGIVACVILYFVVSTIIASIESYRFAKANGCKPATRFPQSERLIGYGVFKQQIAMRKSKTILSSGVQRFGNIGNTYSLVLMGRSMVVTREPENIKAVLATEFKQFGIGARINAMGPLLGHGIFTTDELQWEHSRAMVRPSFIREQVAELGALEDHIQHLFDKIPHDGSTVDLQHLFFQFTLDSATEFLFGEPVGVLRSPAGSAQQLFGEAFDYAQRELAHRMTLGPFLKLYRNKKFDLACTRVHTFVDNLVLSALEFRRESLSSGKTHEKERYVFMNELALATDDPVQIRSELLNVLLAGRDTTAGLLSNTFFILARRPDIWAKLQNEVHQLDGETPDYETLRNMKYVKFVLNESLRLYPSVPGNARFANKMTTIPVGGGPDGKSPIFIPKGTMVLYSLYSMHRRKDIYGEDAEQYRPERWEDIRPGWGYLPFNGGPRVCVGQQYALTVAGYTIVRFVQEFDRIETRDSGEWVENMGLTLSSANGVRVALFPRA